MKNIAYVFLTLIVGSLASPTIPALFKRGTENEVATQERIVTAQILEMIEELKQAIKDAGLDPLDASFEINYELPVAVIFSADIIVRDFHFSGLSNIVVRSMNFSLLQSRLTFEIVMPNIVLSAEKANAEIIFFGNQYTGAISGSFAINTIRLTGDVRVNVGIISGISIRSITLGFSLGGIESRLNVNLLDNDLSAPINNFLGTTVPNTLNEFRNEINELLAAIALDLINNILDSRFF